MARRRKRLIVQTELFSILAIAAVRSAWLNAYGDAGGVIACVGLAVAGLGW